MAARHLAPGAQITHEHMPALRGWLGHALRQRIRSEHRGRPSGLNSGGATFGLKWHQRLINAMSTPAGPMEVSLGRQGRLVIPVALRRSLDLAEGDTLVARQEQGRLVLEKPETIKQRLRARFSHVPAERRLVDELLAERRLDAQRDEG